MQIDKLLDRYLKEVPLKNGFDTVDIDQLEVAAQQFDTTENAMLFNRMAFEYDNLLHHGFELVDNGEATTRDINTYRNRIGRFIVKYADKALEPELAQKYKNEFSSFIKNK